MSGVSCTPPIRCRGGSPPGFVLTFGFFWVVLAFDLSMTLDLHFESTLYGWWWFMTAWVGAIMTFSLLTMWWRKTLHAESLVQERHFHDLGKLAFAFTAFWGYLTFGQYLVLWYGNMGEETHFFRLRAIAPWAPLTAIIATLTFVLPFFGLLSRAAKVYLPTFALFAWSSIIGIWMQRYGEVYPSLYGFPRACRWGFRSSACCSCIWAYGACATSRSWTRSPRSASSS